MCWLADLELLSSLASYFIVRNMEGGWESNHIYKELYL